jgi:hypothetical protein
MKDIKTETLKCRAMFQATDAIKAIIADEPAKALAHLVKAKKTMRKIMEKEMLR